MGGYAESVRERVRAARAAVATAASADDAYALAVAQDELDDALRIAHNIGIDPDRGSGPGPQSGAPA
ncbi:hypothetical protein [Streptomyces natalensis]|uniref:Uncharacterized protein n=1 Tax=Streptomyces natalensis ATCC 27448 TaxID=1240678 RepID=A0A0D7CLJ6_9ACTN|nr:hypothetical protein [Streptomyces natalensis]KIZ16317.1 hypothetical protein SNA_24355 [Streptomyces natalensis ATCC 27448]